MAAANSGRSPASRLRGACAAGVPFLPGGVPAAHLFSEGVPPVVGIRRLTETRYPDQMRAHAQRVRLFFVGGPISLSGGGEAGGNWIRQGVVRSGGGAGGRRYFCRQRPMGDFRWSSRAS